MGLTSRPSKKKRIAAGGSASATINKVTRKDVYPLPWLDDAPDCTHGFAYFSTINLRSECWQISVSDLDREKTAFVTLDVLIQFKALWLMQCSRYI